MRQRHYPQPDLRALLEGTRARQTGPGSYLGHCFAHEDRSPSLSIRETDAGRVLLHCFAGCTWPELQSAGQSLGYLPAYGAAPAPQPPRRRLPATPPEDGERKRRTYREQFRQALPLTSDGPAVRYLAARGLPLTAFPATLRDEAARYWAPADPRPLSLGRFPAMLAAIQGPDGALVGLHRTYLMGHGKARLIHPDSGEVLPAKKMWAIAPGATQGAAVRLHPVTDCLVVAEGIETTLAAHLASGRPAWAALSANGLARLVVPQEVQDVLIAADADDAGEAAANTLATRLIRKGRIVRIATPSAGDWADVYQEAAHG